VRSSLVFYLVKRCFSWFRLTAGVGRKNGNRHQAEPDPLQQPQQPNANELAQARRWQWRPESFPGSQVTSHQERRHTWVNTPPAEGTWPRQRHWTPGKWLITAGPLSEELPRKVTPEAGNRNGSWFALDPFASGARTVPKQFLNYRMCLGVPTTRCMWANWKAACSKLVLEVESSIGDRDRDQNQDLWGLLPWQLSVAIADTSHQAM